MLSFQTVDFVWFSNKSFCSVRIWLGIFFSLIICQMVVSGNDCCLLLSIFVALPLEFGFARAHKPTSIQSNTFHLMRILNKNSHCAVGYNQWLLAM